MQDDSGNILVYAAKNNKSGAFATLRDSGDGVNIAVRYKGSRGRVYEYSITDYIQEKAKKPEQFIKEDVVSTRRPGQSLANPRVQLDTVIVNQSFV